MRRTIVAAWTVLGLLAAAVATSAEIEPASPAGRRVVVVDVEGIITTATVDYLEAGLARAREVEAAAFIIRMDTPGGLFSATQVIVKMLLTAPLPTVVFVGPAGAGATSAGVFITLAASVAAMAPGTNIGAAHPVSGQGGDIEGEMGKKVENTAASLSRTIAEQRGRNVEWAEKAVRESVSVTEKEALELGVIDVVARDIESLLVAIDGREVEIEGSTQAIATAGARIERLKMTTRQKILTFIASPNIAFILLALGGLGLYMEFTNPGALFPGIGGAICLLLGMWALQLLPVNYIGLALIFLGMLLLVAEAFVPSFGILGIGGLVAFVFGGLLLFDTPDAAFRIDRRLVFSMAAVLGTTFLLMGWLVVRAHRQQPAGGAEGMIGEVGRVRRAPDGRGLAKVFVHGENWDAVVDGTAEAGDAVEIVSVEGLRVRVRRAREET